MQLNHYLILLSGIQAGNISLTISSPDANVSLYYTTDGSTPTLDQLLYQEQLRLTTNTVIRCISISSDPNIPKVFRNEHLLFQYIPYNENTIYMWR